MYQFKAWAQRHWKALTFVGAAFMTALALLDSSTLQGMYKRFFASPKLELSYESDGEVNPGDSVVLKYVVPPSGYMSIWNQNAAGETNRLLPLQGGRALAVNKRIISSSFEIRALSEVGEERLVLLWTPIGYPEHLPRNHYSSAQSFDGAFKSFKQRSPSLRKKVITIPIFP